MIIDSEGLEDVFRTFSGQDFATAIAAARRLIGAGGTSISRTDTTVPTRELQRIYARSALNPRVRHAVAEQFKQLARIADLFPSESWHIFIVAIGEQPEVTIFSNEEGVGRVCLYFTVP
jgi:hypothetical protein